MDNVVGQAWWHKSGREVNRIKVSVLQFFGEDKAAIAIPPKNQVRCVPAKEIFMIFPRKGKKES